MPRTVTFEFKDEDLERLDALRASGYKFFQVMLMDGRGRDRYVDICVHNPTTAKSKGDADVR